LTDLHILTLPSPDSQLPAFWREEIITPTKHSKPLSEFKCLGRTHCSTVVGDKIIFFAGHRTWCNEVGVLDMANKTIFTPELIGRPPCKRMDPKSAFKDGKIWIWGGYAHFRENMGDLWYLHLCRKEGIRQFEDQDLSEEQEIPIPRCIQQ